MIEKSKLMSMSIPELMIENNFPIPGNRFSWIEDIELTPDELVFYEAKILPMKKMLVEKLGKEVIFSDLEILPADKDHIFYQAKLDRYMFKQQQEKKIVEKERREAILKPWSQADLEKNALLSAHQLCERRGKKFVMDANATRVWKLLLMYFSNDPRFEECGEGFSLKKSIFLKGEVGCGKTTILRAFEKNKKQCFKFYPCEQIAIDAKKQGDNGLATLDKFTKFISAGGEGVFYQPQIGWLLDDAGREALINDYGTKLEPMQYILSQHYNRLEKGEGLCFHITTNMDALQIESRYGYYIRSRMRELYNVINYSGEDRR